MVERRWIDQLESSDTQSRKIAIQQLARSRDEAAIPYLEKVAGADADETVRDIARKAVIFIQRNSGQPAPEKAAEPTPAEPEHSAFPPPQPLIPPEEPRMDPKQRFMATSIISEYNRADDDEAEAPALPPPMPKPTTYAVTPQNAKAAKNALASAGQASFEEEPGKAARYLVEAFKLDPNLQRDNYAIGMATTISGLHKGDAVKAVLDGSILQLFSKEELKGSKTPKAPQKSKNGIEHIPKATLKSKLISMGVTLVILAGFIFLVISESTPPPPIVVTNGLVTDVPPAG